MERRRFSYVLIGLLVFLVIGVFLTFWRLGALQNGPSGASTLSLRSVREARQVLQAWSSANWAADSAIVACTLSLSRRSTAAPDWSFQVYSAQKKHLLVAVVHEEGVYVLRDMPALYPPLILPATAWEYDSQDILNTWWHAGGATAWAKAGRAVLALRLGMREDNIPVWQLTLEESNTTPMEYWEIRADTGKLVEHTLGGQ